MYLLTTILVYGRNRWNNGRNRRAMTETPEIFRKYKKLLKKLIKFWKKSRPAPLKFLSFFSPPPPHIKSLPTFDLILSRLCWEKGISVEIETGSRSIDAKEGLLMCK